MAGHGYGSAWISLSTSCIRRQSSLAQQMCFRCMQLPAGGRCRALQRIGGKPWFDDCQAVRPELYLRVRTGVAGDNCGIFPKHWFPLTRDDSWIPVVTTSLHLVVSEPHRFYDHPPTMAKLPHRGTAGAKGPARDGAWAVCLPGPMESVAAISPALRHIPRRLALRRLGGLFWGCHLLPMTQPMTINGI